MFFYDNVIEGLFMKKENLIKNLIGAVLILVTLFFGVRPILTRSHTRFNSNEYDFEANEYGMIVIGSEPEGLAAALASARTGLKTLLVTEDKSLGSYIKRCMISKMDPQQGLIKGKRILLNQGIYQEIFGKFNVSFSGQDYENSITKLIEKEKNLKVIYEGKVTEVKTQGRSIKSIGVEEPDGMRYYKGRVFIDATQDGDLLMLCGTPYFNGTEDLGISDFYSPVEFNFRISGVDVEALKKSRKVSNFIDEFQLVLLNYEKVNPKTKLLNPSFIILNDDEIVISGLQVFGVNVNDEDELRLAYEEAKEEAIMLTAFLKNTLIAFKDCTYKESPESFFIPEYRHFEGRYRLTVADIMENRDFPDKVALCSQEVDASKFVDKNLEYVVVKPNVYSIPLGSLIPVNLDNVLMLGSKAGFSSLAATSAGSIPTRITVGEAAGLVSVYSNIRGLPPAGLLDLPDKEKRSMVNYIKRGGVMLTDFEESILIPDTKDKLSDHWSFPYIKTLAEYGLISGGRENDFKLDFKASQELLVVLIKNAILKMRTESYSIDINIALKPYEIQKELTGETAGAIVLEALSIHYESGKALQTLKDKGIIPADILNRLEPGAPVTMDTVYGLAVETVNYIK